jgi:hypothetical protein
MPPGFFARSFGRKPSPVAEREQEAQDDTKQAVDQHQQRAGALVSTRKDAKLEWEETRLERPDAADTPPPAAAAAVAGIHAPAAAEQAPGSNQSAGPAAAATHAKNKKKSVFKQLFAKCEMQQH